MFRNELSKLKYLYDSRREKIIGLQMSSIEDEDK